MTCASTISWPGGALAKLTAGTGPETAVRSDRLYTATPVVLTAWMKYSGPIAPPTSAGLTPVVGPRPGALRSTFGAGPEGAAASGANADPAGLPLVSAVPPMSGLLAVVFVPGEVLSTAGVATALCAGT